MATDEVRVDAYAAAISRAVCGKRVLDVGSGPFVLLTRMCIKSLVCIHAVRRTVARLRADHVAVRACANSYEGAVFDIRLLMVLATLSPSFALLG